MEELLMSTTAHLATCLDGLIANPDRYAEVTTALEQYGDTHFAGRGNGACGYVRAGRYAIQYNGHKPTYVEVDEERQYLGNGVCRRGTIVWQLN